MLDPWPSSEGRGPEAARAACELGLPTPSGGSDWLAGPGRLKPLPPPSPPPPPPPLPRRSCKPWELCALAPPADDCDWLARAGGLKPPPPRCRSREPCDRSWEPCELRSHRRPSSSASAGTCTTSPRKVRNSGDGQASAASAPGGRDWAPSGGVSWTSVKKPAAGAGVLVCVGRGVAAAPCRVEGAGVGVDCTRVTAAGGVGSTADGVSCGCGCD